MSVAHAGLRADRARCGLMLRGARCFLLLSGTAILAVALLAGLSTAPVWAADPPGMNGATGGAGGSGSLSNGGKGGVAGATGENGSGLLPGSGGGAGTFFGSPNGSAGNPGAGIGSGGGGGGGFSQLFSNDIIVPVTGGKGGNGGSSGNGSPTGGGGGGGGGDGARIGAASLVTVSADVTGGTGGNGGNGTGSRGAGGGGGAGIVLQNSRGLTVDAAVVAGGNGGASGDVYGGGGGGAGVVLQQGGALSVMNTGASVIGGNGGNGGNGGSGVVANALADVTISAAGTVTGGQGNSTGSGGAGLQMLFVGTVVNAGTVRGGNAGNGTTGGVPGAAGGFGSGGAAGSIPNTYQRAGGGVGITGAGLSIANSGTIAGGTSSFGQADAIVFTGGANFLGNTGTITGGIAVQGGSFAPALATSPIGTALNIGSGPLTFLSGTSYNIRVSSTASDSVKTTGSATLTGATVNASIAPGSYVAKQYTILTAGNLGNTSFAGVNLTGQTSNLASTLSYNRTLNAVYLNLALNFATPASVNRNQAGVANTLTNFFNTTGGIAGAFASLSPQGMTQVSGEVATRTQQATFDVMTLFMGVMTDPFGAGHGNEVASQAGASSFARETALSYASNRKPRSAAEREAYATIYNKAPAAAPFAQHWSLWAAGYGGSQSTDGNAGVGSNNATSSIYGVVAGADYRISPDTLVGFALAGGGTNFSVANSGTGRSDLFQAGAFMRHSMGAAYMTAALAYGWQNITTDRIVTAGGVDHLRANFNANAFSGRVESGYRFVAPAFGGVGFTPYAAAQITAFDLPSYAEQAISGANTFAINYASKDVFASRSELGLRTDKSFALNEAILTLRGRAAWAHNFNTDRSIAATFQTLPGASFVVNGAGLAPDSALVTASAETKWRNNVSLAATFEGEFSGVTQSYAGKGVARYTW